MERFWHKPLSSTPHIPLVVYSYANKYFYEFALSLFPANQLCACSRHRANLYSSIFCIRKPLSDYPTQYEPETNHILTLSTFHPFIHSILVVCICCFVCARKWFIFRVRQQFICRQQCFQITFEQQLQQQYARHQLNLYRISSLEIAHGAYDTNICAVDAENIQFSSGLTVRYMFCVFIYFFVRTKLDRNPVTFGRALSAAYIVLYSPRPSFHLIELLFEIQLILRYQFECINGFVFPLLTQFELFINNEFITR